MILCLGTTPALQRSMIFNGFAIDAVNRAVEVYEYASGKSVNVARVLRTLGEDPLATGFVGGARGRSLLQDMERAGVRHDFVAVEVPTRLCTTVIDRATRTATELVEESAPVEPEAWQQLDARMRVLLPNARVAVFSGSLPPGAPQDFFARWLPLAAASGTRVVVDTRGEPLRLVLRHGNVIAKLNREELADTVGEPLDTDARLRDAMKASVPAGGALVVTLGARGAVAAAGTGFWRVIAPAIETLSAVGSGDAFAAGLAAGLLRGQPLRDACAYAAACGAANAMTPLAGHVRPEDVEALYRQVRVQEE